MANNHGQSSPIPHQASGLGPVKLHLLDGVNKYLSGRSV